MEFNDRPALEKPISVEVIDDRTVCLKNALSLSFRESLQLINTTSSFGGSQVGKSWLISQISSVAATKGDGAPQTAEANLHPVQGNPNLFLVDNEGYTAHNDLPKGATNVDKFASGYLMQERSRILHEYLPYLNYMMANAFILVMRKTADIDKEIETLLSKLPRIANKGWPKIWLIVILNSPPVWRSEYEDPVAFTERVKRLVTNMGRLNEFFVDLHAVAIPDEHGFDENNNHRYRPSNAATAGARRILIEKAKSRILQLLEDAQKFKRLSGKQIANLVDWSIKNQTFSFAEFLQQANGTPIKDLVAETIREDFQTLQLLNSTVSKKNYIRSVKLSLLLLLAKVPIKINTVLKDAAQQFLAQVRLFEPCAYPSNPNSKPVCCWLKHNHDKNWHSANPSGFLSFFQRFHSNPPGFYQNRDFMNKNFEQLEAIANEIIGLPWENLFQHVETLIRIIMVVQRAQSEKWKRFKCLSCSGKVDAPIHTGCLHKHICSKCTINYFKSDQMKPWERALSLVGIPRNQTEDWDCDCKVCIFLVSKVPNTLVVLREEQPDSFEKSINFNQTTNEVLPFEMLDYRIRLQNSSGKTMHINVKKPIVNDPFLFLYTPTRIDPGKTATISVSMIALNDERSFDVPLTVDINANKSYQLLFKLKATTLKLPGSNRFNELYRSMPTDFVKVQPDSCSWNYSEKEKLFYVRRSFNMTDQIDVSLLDNIAQVFRITGLPGVAPLVGYNVTADERTINVALMFMVRGQPLPQFVETFKNLSKNHKIQLKEQLEQALAGLCSHRIYHQALIADNVWVYTNDTGGYSLMLTDPIDIGAKESDALDVLAEQRLEERQNQQFVNIVFHLWKGEPRTPGRRAPDAPADMKELFDKYPMREIPPLQLSEYTK